MSDFVFLYQRLDAGTDWLPMLQHQAIVSAARAILTHSSSSEPRLSNHKIFAPLNLDVLPLLATVASDYADFAEPEGDDRPRTPIHLYEDEVWKEDGEEADEMRHLLHQSWFDRTQLSLFDLVTGYRPRNCIIFCHPKMLPPVARDVLPLFKRVLTFRHLMGDGGDAGVPDNITMADDIFDSAADAGTASPSAWHSMLIEGTAPQLEPFVAFGPAIEMVSLLDED